MPVLSRAEFSAALPLKGRLMGWDVGTKTLGIALSDERRVIATPFKTLQRKQWKHDQVVLRQLMHDYAIVGLVVGLPLHMRGHESPRSQAVRQIVENYLAVHDLPVLLWDERLSTVAVTRTLLEADMSRKKRADVVDQLAASYILQGGLDALSSS